MTTLKLKKGISLIIAFFSLYTVLDILRIYLFLGERGISFGNYDLNYLSRFMYSFNFPIKDIKILIFSNVIIFSLLFIISSVLYVKSKFDFILNWLLYVFLIFNTISIMKTFATIITIKNTTTTEYLKGLIVTLIIYILFELLFVFTINKVKKIKTIANS